MFIIHETSRKVKCLKIAISQGFMTLFVYAVKRAEPHYEPKGQGFESLAARHLQKASFVCRQKALFTCCLPGDNDAARGDGIASRRMRARGTEQGPAASLRATKATLFQSVREEYHSPPGTAAVANAKCRPPLQSKRRQPGLFVTIVRKPFKFYKIHKSG